MLEELRIIANQKNNQLSLILDGYFLMSEVELTLHRIKRESRKLRSGFEVLIDIRNFRTASKSQDHIISRMKKVLRILGSGNIVYTQNGKKRTSQENGDLFYINATNVGLYS